ncbi:hypothetical protein IKG48_02240 [Candidatus Saccharibacteria bacterium]|nr:hypothetical protein [Candidatus Saccharibacteria bacterium]
MKKKGFFDKLAGAIDPDDNRIANYGGYDVKLDSKADDDDDKPDTEFKKEEILLLVEDYQKKDNSISIELAKLVGNNKISARAQELVLDGKIDLKVFLSDIIKADKAGTAQQIIDGLATKPEPKPEPKPESKPEPKPEPEPQAKALPTAFNPKRFEQELIFSLREHPDIKEHILDPKTDLAPRAVDVFYDERNDQLHDNPLLFADIQGIIYERFAGKIEEACGPKGWYVKETRVADRYGNPTNEIFPKEPPKKG